MTIRTLAITRIDRTVADLAASERFYIEALGFMVVENGPTHAALLAAPLLRQTTLRRGAQLIALQQRHPGGHNAPAANDQSFQHLALPVPDMNAALAQLAPFDPVAISRGGPQHLPPRSGGATAYKFRDPDGHPLELIQFPGRARAGIDHSAIVVADVERSIAFYRDTLGFAVATRQTNTGPEQNRLDGLSGTEVEVVALQPATPTPHLELLAYRKPPVEVASPDPHPATRLVLVTTGLDQPATLIQDPDGHALILLQH